LFTAKVIRCSREVQGKPWSPETFTSLMDDLEEPVFGPLPDDTWLYLGHGDDSTLGGQRPRSPDWRARGW